MGVPALTGPGADQGAHHAEPGIGNVTCLGTEGTVRTLGPTAPAAAFCINSRKQLCWVRFSHCDH